MVRFLVIFFLSASVAQAKPAKAIYDLDVLEELSVYKEADEDSTVISRLNRGDKVVISQKEYGEFRKVLVTYRGRPTPGYILSSTIKRSQIRERGSAVGARKPYSQNYGVGLGAAISYLKQGKYTFQQTDGRIYDTGEFTSMAFFPAFFFDVPMTPTWGLRAYLDFRETKFKSTATPRNLGITTSQKVERNQSFTGLGLITKFYPSADAGWWWGGGGELAFGKKVTIKVSNVEIATDEKAKPMFLIVYGAAGFELNLFSSIYLVPDVRIGSVVTTKPITLFAETFLSFAYQF